MIWRLDKKFVKVRFESEFIPVMNEVPSSDEDGGIRELLRNSKKSRKEKPYKEQTRNKQYP